MPAFSDASVFWAGDLGFAQAEFSIHTLPLVSGFIGGDILAAALAVDMESQPVGALLVDLGTNGELVLKGEVRLFATSCATGPAFEGASLACGMQASPGAINAVTIDDHQKVSAISLIHPDHGPEKLKPPAMPPGPERSWPSATPAIWTGPPGWLSISRLWILPWTSSSRRCLSGISAFRSFIR